MNKTNLELRKVLVRMHNLGKTPAEISQITGIKIRTIYNHIKTLKTEGEGKLLSNPKPITRQTKLDLVKFKKYLEENPLAFHREVGEAFGIKKSTAHKWRKKLGLTRKKAKTTYKEANEDLKKSS